MSARLHLVIPGLLGPVPRGARDLDLPRLPVLEAVLSRGDAMAFAGGYLETVFTLFDVVDPVLAAPVTAPLCYAYDCGAAASAWVMHADPVHLRADQDRLILFPAKSLAIESHEATALVDAFNAHFAEQGLVLCAPVAERWYITMSGAPGIETRLLGDVVGRDIAGYLPVGERQGYWRSLLNEVQMLFHGLEVNVRREQRGMPGISGLWFSGAGSGALPVVNARFAQVDTDEPLISALWGQAARGGDQALCVELRPWRALLAADGGAWIDALKSVERDLQARLDAGQDLELYPCNGCRVAWRGAMRRRWWRRRLAFAARVSG